MESVVSDLGWLSVSQSKGVRYWAWQAFGAPWMNSKTGQWEDTFAIITSDPNTKMSEIVELGWFCQRDSRRNHWLPGARRRRCNDGLV
jgi:putative SOS response-associated peptidase YedK